MKLEGSLARAARLHRNTLMAHARHFAAFGLVAVLATAAVVRSVWGEDHVHALAPDALHDVKPDGAAPQPAAHAPAASVPADDAVNMLVDGNARFVSGKPDRPHLGQ